MIIWKGKGIMIFLYFIVTTIVLAIVNRLIIVETFGISSELRIEVFMGMVLIITGIWTKITADDYYIDKDGRRKSLEIENSLFFIKMSTWGLILPSVGVGLIIYEMIDSF
jgi:hypothetical protein